MWSELRDLATQMIVRAQPLRVNAVTVMGDKVKVTMSFVSIGARCPSCHKVSRRVHSRYTRRPTDMVWGGLTTELDLHIRRFHCDTPNCAQQIFAEQLPQYLRRYGRRTESLEDQLLLLAWVAGGEAGIGVAERFHIPISADTLLRITRRRGGTADSKTPRVLGVDDWAFRKGRRYGTILCDLERACVVDLLPDREAKTLADWLIAHPGVEIISRDRGGAYAEGARQGAPDAIQVADRFHLLMNLKDAVKRVAEQHHAVIRKCAVDTPAVAVPEPTADMTAPSAAPAMQKAVRQSDLEKQACDERYHARYDAVTKLHAAGATQREISQQLGLARNTVAKLLSAPDYPGVPARGPQPQVAAPFHDYLVQRWNAGIHNIRQLQREICEQGYTGNYSSLWNYLQPWQRTQPIKRAIKHPGAAVPTPHQAAWTILTHPDKRTELQKQHVAMWAEACPELSKTQDLAQAFGTLVRSRQADQLDGWINAARDSGIAIWTRFAASLRSDYDAVLNALKLPWSNGPVEGNVQRLKLIKRQAYGRANLDLLKARVMQPA